MKLARSKAGCEQNDSPVSAETKKGTIPFRGDRRGAAVVEIDLTAPILFMILFTSLEFSRYNMIQQTAYNAAFEGARQGILPGATAADCQTAGENVLKQVGIKNYTVTISPNPITNPTTHVTATQVTATVSVPVANNLWIKPMYLGSGTITKTCTLTCDWVNSQH